MVAHGDTIVSARAAGVNLDPIISYRPDGRGLVALLRETVLACQDRDASPDNRLAAVEGLLLPEADAILARCEAHAAVAGNNSLPLLRRFYGGQRAAFLRFLAHAAPVSTSQDRATEQAIAFLLAHRKDRRPKLQVTGKAMPGLCADNSTDRHVPPGRSPQRD
jgi:hypothetical protein